LLQNPAVAKDSGDSGQEYREEGLHAGLLYGKIAEVLGAFLVDGEVVRARDTAEIPVNNFAVYNRGDEASDA
jgi:hypothetical protein